MGVQLGAMPADAAGLVRVRLGGQSWLAAHPDDGMSRLQAMYRRVAVLPSCCRTWTWCWPRATSRSPRATRNWWPTGLRKAIFSRLRAEWQDSVEPLLTIMGQNSLLESNPLLARSIRNRFPYLDPLNHMQIELLKRYRGGETDEAVVTGIHLTINGIAAGLRNSG